MGPRKTSRCSPLQKGVCVPELGLVQHTLKHKGALYKDIRTKALRPGWLQFGNCCFSGLVCFLFLCSEAYHI